MSLRECFIGRCEDGGDAERPIARDLGNLGSCLPGFRTGAALEGVDIRVPGRRRASARGVAYNLQEPLPPAAKNVM